MNLIGSVFGAGAPDMPIAATRPAASVSTGRTTGTPPRVLQIRTTSGKDSIPETPPGCKGAPASYNHRMPAFLETDRITLRQFTEDDAPLLLALDSDPEVMRYCGPYGLPDEAAYRERIRHYFQPYYAKGPRFGFWAAEEKATGRFIGWFHLRPALDYRSEGRSVGKRVR